MAGDLSADQRLRSQTGDAVVRARRSDAINGRRRRRAAPAVQPPLVRDSSRVLVADSERLGETRKDRHWHRTAPAPARPDKESYGSGAGCRAAAAQAGSGRAGAPASAPGGRGLPAGARRVWERGRAGRGPEIAAGRARAASTAGSPGPAGAFAGPAEAPAGPGTRIDCGLNTAIEYSEYNGRRFGCRHRVPPTSRRRRRSGPRLLRSAATASQNLRAVRRGGRQLGAASCREGWRRAGPVYSSGSARLHSLGGPPRFSCETNKP